MLVEPTHLKITDTLNRLGAYGVDRDDICVVGSASLIPLTEHLHSTTTLIVPEDVDIIVPPPVFSRLAASLPNYLRACHTNGFYGQTLVIPAENKSGLPLELTQQWPVQGLTNENIRAEQMPYFGFNMMTSAHALASARALGRPKDCARLEELCI